MRRELVALNYFYDINKKVIGNKESNEERLYLT
jgi:hypothetical protein